MSDYDTSNESGSGQKPTREEIRDAVLTAADNMRRNFVVSQLVYQENLEMHRRYGPPNGPRVRDIEAWREGYDAWKIRGSDGR